MILELKIKNFLSFKNEVTLSFEATKDKKLEDYQVVEIAKGIRILKLGVIYGANASGKSNLIKAFEFLRNFCGRATKSRDLSTKAVPFLLDSETPQKPSSFKLTFFVGETMFVYSLELTEINVLWERLDFYPGVQPANVFERKLANSISEITFGPKIKISPVAKDEIAIKCLSNMSFFAAYKQVNVRIPEIEMVTDWILNQFMPSIEPRTDLQAYSERVISDDENIKNRMLSFLKHADFNISAINSEKITFEFFDNAGHMDNISGQEIDKFKRENTVTRIKTTFEHEIIDERQNLSHYPLSIEDQSEGTKRIFGLTGVILKAINRNAFLAIDELESKLHPQLVDFVIEQFLKESKQAQLLVSTHYDGLFDEDDLLRKDSIWFTEKKQDASSTLYSLADFNGVNRLTSIQKAYRFGKFGAIPNIE